MAFQRLQGGGNRLLASKFRHRKQWWLAVVVTVQVKQSESLVWSGVIILKPKACQQPEGGIGTAHTVLRYKSLGGLPRMNAGIFFL